MDGEMKKLVFFLMICLPTTSWSANLQYALDVRVNTAEKKIIGTARLKARADIKTDLAVRNLKLLKLTGADIVNSTGDSLRLSMKKGSEIKISYEAVINENRNNFIDKDDVFLTSDWYPQPDVLAEYAFTVTLPENFTAVSESEFMGIQKHGQSITIAFEFSHPLDSLHLAASSRWVRKTDRYKNIDIETYFFKEDAHLSDAYLAYTQKYLAMYEKMLTPYPYRRFAVVENILPTGNSMPTFTLLGSQVVRLPFIVETSLGHEILHQWFGNSVYIDFASGNWAEGLTTYLSDCYYAELEGKGSAYRKQILVNYNAYIHPDNAIPLSDFQSRNNSGQSAVGYGKAAMLFHGLRRLYGNDIFYSAIRDFILKNRFRQASWLDIQHAFESATGNKLYTYFGDWLTRKSIPRLQVENTQLYVEQGQLKLSFDLLQPQDPYPLHIPITRYMDKHKITQWVDVRNSKEKISLALDEPPDKVVMDENYDLMRQLAPDETPPVLAGIMGKEKLIVVISSSQRSTYQPLIDAVGVKSITYVEPDKITFDQIQKNSLLIAGDDNPVADMMLGKLSGSKDGVYLKVYKNPYNESERVVWLHAAGKKEALAVQYKIPHYGKYTELAFTNGRNTFKAIAETENGIQVLSRPPARALNPNTLPTLHDIIPRLSSSRIVYVGEIHDQYAHHMNQLKVIKEIHEAGYQLAVGMEMFQRPFQPVVDDYLAGRIDEYTFLKKTEYFSRWGYDYNLYKPIVDYLKQQHIPLIALNIQGDITHKVAREGIYALSGAEKKQLPSAMNFSDEPYRKDLRQVFSVHNQQEDLRDFNYFLQAQLLWDEGMAETAYRFLTKHPGFKMVILAGNGHVRHRYGIPDRLYRREQDPFVVVVQDEEIEEGVGDYVLLTTKLDGEASPKLGVTVEEKDRHLVITGVGQNTPAQKAGLKTGDVIQKFEDRPIQSLADLKLNLFFSKSGETVKIQIKRADKMIDKKIELFHFNRFLHKM
jgi:aminopeptidase N